MKELEIEHLDKYYGKTLVLHDINLSVNPGEIYGILGRSGAGKSTLVRCINGLENYEGGSINFEGHRLSSPKEKIKREDCLKMAMIFQNFNLLDQLDALANVELALRFAGVKKDQEVRALESLSLVGLADKAHAYPSTLSGGEKQRVAIARALVNKPSLLLSDEATSALDPETSASILELLAKLNQELSLTILMISHQMNVIESICQKVAIIDHSEVVESGDLSDVFLSPKSEIAKKLIYSSHLQTTFSDKRLLRLRFNGNVDEPLLANIVQDCGILVSVVYADTKVIGNKTYGQILLKLPLGEKENKKLLKYLILHHVNYEEVTNHESV